MEKINKTNEETVGSAAAGEVSSETLKPQNKEKAKKKKRSALSYAAELLIKIAATVLGVWLLCTYVIAIHVNHSNASYPMLKDGDLCISYRLGDIREGEEVSYKHDGKVCFGRVVALSGDTVEIKNGYVSVDGYAVLEDVVYETTAEGSLIEYPYTVADNSVFVLNDFRNDVEDSRSFGAIDRSEIEGKVIFVIRRRGI